MKTKILIPILTLMAFLGVGVAQAQLKPSSEVLLPYFEVDLKNAGKTTLLAVGNILDQPVEGQIEVRTNWGIPISTFTIQWEPRELKSFNLRDWLLDGKMPNRTLRVAEKDQMKATLTGQRSLKDNLLYSTPVAPDVAVGSVIIRTTGDRPAAFWGDYLLVDPSRSASLGDSLVNLDLSSSCQPGLCDKHALRFLAGVAVEADTEVVLWTETVGQPRQNAYPEYLKFKGYAAIYDESGKHVEDREIRFTPLQVVTLGSLGLSEPFGWIELRTDVPVFIGIHYNRLKSDGAALQAYCVPEIPQLPDPDPGIDIKKWVNGQDADTAPGPKIPIGSVVTWDYIVRNTGATVLTDVKVSDDDLSVQVTCPKTELEIGESMTCKGQGIAQACQYKNIGTAVGTSPDGFELKDQDPSHYYGDQNAKIEIETAINGEDADDSANGPTLSEGAAVSWTYKVTNTGDVTLTGILVADDKGLNVTCPKTSLHPGESMTCSASGLALLGLFRNVGAVTAKASCGPDVQASDPTHYFGRKDEPGIKLQKITNGLDCSLPPGPMIPVGDPVLWEYVVTNIGNVLLTDIKVTDDKGVVVTCPKTTLLTKESMTCTGRGVAVACQYINLGIVTAKTLTGQALKDKDASYYFGQHHAAIDIEKATNGQDADTAPGPTIPVGDPVTWTYMVTNTGDVALTNVTVTDDKGVNVTCPKNTLQPGESMTCTGKGTAVKGQYRNVGTVTGLPPCGPPVTDQDASHYFGDMADPEDPEITIKKYTNGQDADTAPGPHIQEKDPVVWTYIVTNVGNTSLSNVKVTDDRGVAVSCPKTSLQSGESMTCTGKGTAAVGQYKNIGSVVGTPPKGPNVTDDDPSHYYGDPIPVDPTAHISIKKYTNGQDADEAPGPKLTVGDSVQWTYIVLNDGEVSLSNIKVTDDRGVLVSCPKTLLQVGESMTCTGNGIATAGQYKNIGSVVGTPPTGPNVNSNDPSHYYGEQPTGTQGCTPGYWKNHTDSWAAAGYNPSTQVASVFSEASGYPSLGSASLLDALSFSGGSTLDGAAGNLLRAAVAGLLDASHPGVDYPRSPASVIADVNAALATRDRDTILGLASAIDADNNLGCPLN